MSRTLCFPWITVREIQTTKIRPSGQKTTLSRKRVMLQKEKMFSVEEINKCKSHLLRDLPVIFIIWAGKISSWPSENYSYANEWCSSGAESIFSACSFPRKGFTYLHLKTPMVYFKLSYILFNILCNITMMFQNNKYIMTINYPTFNDTKKQIKSC